MALQKLAIPAQVGLVLQGARRALKLTQGDVARRVGISQSRLSAMELDASSMSVEQLLALCGALNLDLLICPKDHPLGPPTDW